MEEKFLMLDEFGQEKEAEILNIIGINNQEYLVYKISKNEEEDSIYASKLVRDANGEENIISIEDEEEKRIVFDAIRELLDELD